MKDLNQVKNSNMMETAVTIKIKTEVATNKTEMKEALAIEMRVMIDKTREAIEKMIGAIEKTIEVTEKMREVIMIEILEAKIVEDEKMTEVIEMIMSLGGEKMREVIEKMREVIEKMIEVLDKTLEDKMKGKIMRGKL